MTRDERAAANRARVLKAAGALFRRKGFHGAGVDEIAEAAGFSKGVVYSQFGSKDDLFLALLEEHAAARIARTRERAAAAPPGRALGEVSAENLAVWRQDPEWYLLFVEFRAHAARHPDVNRRFAALHRKLLLQVAEVFEVLAEGAHPDPRFDAVDFARLIVRLDAGAVLEQVVEGPGSSFELASHAFDLLLNEHAPGNGPWDGSGSPPGSG